MAHVPLATAAKNSEDTTYPYGFSYPTDQYDYIAQPGLSHQLVDNIGDHQADPDWLRTYRHQALDIFTQLPLPTWGADLSGLDFSSLYYYLQPVPAAARTWKDVPAAIQETFTRIGVPQAEREYLAGVKMQYDSTIVYGSLREQWAKDGVIFCSMAEGVRRYPDLVKQYFGTIVPIGDNKLAALNSAVWSGGSFVYVPPNVQVKAPLQTYFRINAAAAGQFERTLIIVDEGAQVHYVEGCSAPQYSAQSLHAAVVEIVVKKGARCQYTTIQNWYKNVYNLVTKRAWVGAGGEMIWTDCNVGSGITMKYPAFILAERGAQGTALSLAVAGNLQYLDTGCKAIHLAPDTRSTILAKSISKNGGCANYRGLVHLGPQAQHSQNRVVCDALIMDPASQAHTYPNQRVLNSTSTLAHEATVSRINEEQLFYAMSRGLSEEEAHQLIIRGFTEPLVRQLPLEYAVEMNRLIAMEMSGAVG